MLSFGSQGTRLVSRYMYLFIYCRWRVFLHSLYGGAYLTLCIVTILTALAPPPSMMNPTSVHDTVCMYVCTVLCMILFSGPLSVSLRPGTSGAVLVAGRISVPLKVASRILYRL